jgi:outer membrane lipoprotein-sorting protein
MARWTIGLVVAAVAAVPAAAQDAAEAVVKKAIDAHGGLETLKKYPAGTSKMKGTMTIMGLEIPFTGSIAFQVPAKYRLELEADAMGMKVALTQIVNGDQVKQLENGRPTPLPDAAKEELRQAAVLQELSLLYPLLDRAKYTLKAERDGDVGGKPAAVVLVQSKGLKDTRLFFDKQTGYLVKMERKGLDPEMKEVNEETVFSDFQKVAGMMVSMKATVTHDGKPFLSITSSDYKPMEKVDAKTFATGD